MINHYIIMICCNNKILFLLLGFFNCLLIDCCSPSTGLNKRRKASNGSLLGTNFQVIDLIKSVSEGHVVQPEDLRCFEFGDTCKWRNLVSGSLDEMDWYQTDANITKLILQLLTGYDRPPKSPFAMASTAVKMNPETKAILVSEPIPCISGDGELRLKYWASPSTELLVCTKRLNFRLPDYDFCSSPMTSPSSGPTIFQIPGPIIEPFEIFIRAESFVYNSRDLQGGFVIIDDLEFVSDFCPSKSEQCELQRLYCNSVSCSNPSLISDSGFIPWCQECRLCQQVSMAVTPVLQYSPKLKRFRTGNQDFETTPVNPFLLHHASVRRQQKQEQKFAISTLQTPNPNSVYCPNGFEPWFVATKKPGLKKKVKFETTYLCYKILGLIELWPAASIACKTFGAHLPSFRDRTEALDFSSYARLKNVLKTWIGLRDLNGNGSPTDEFWDDNIPYWRRNDTQYELRFRWSNNNSITNGCTVLDVWNKKWSWTDCNNNRYAVICQIRL